MKYDGYGYGPLGDELIDLFHSGTLDFSAAEALIRQGADLNAIGTNDNENILSAILLGFGATAAEGTQPSPPGPDSLLCRTIRFFSTMALT